MMEEIEEKEVEKVWSENQTMYFSILAKSDGSFRLEKFIQQFDVEEEVNYWIKQYGSFDPIFANASLARTEALRLIDLEMNYNA